MERSETYRYDAEPEPAEMLAGIGRVAEQWDGEWQPEGGGAGRLGLPVTAGLRRGWLAGGLEVEARDGGGSRLLYTVDRGEMKTDRGSVFVLTVGALGGLVTMIAPFVPSLWTLVPLGLLLGFSAWLLVVARLKSAGPEEFFSQVEAEIAPVADAGPADTGGP